MHDRVRDRLARLLAGHLSRDVAVSVEGSLQLDRLTLIEPDVLVFPEAAAAPSAEGFREVPASRILLAIEVAVSSLSYDR